MVSWLVFIAAAFVGAVEAHGSHAHGATAAPGVDVYWRCSPRTQFTAHTVLMLVGTIVLLPLGMIAGRRAKASSSVPKIAFRWRIIHVGIQVAVLTLVLVGYGYMYYQNDFTEHFDTNHNTAGLGFVVLFGLQFVMGIIFSLTLWLKEQAKKHAKFSGHIPSLDKFGFYARLIHQFLGFVLLAFAWAMAITGIIAWSAHCPSLPARIALAREAAKEFISTDYHFLVVVLPSWVITHDGVYAATLALVFFFSILQQVLLFSWSRKATQSQLETMLPLFLRSLVVPAIATLATAAAFINMYLLMTIDAGIYVSLVSGVFVAALFYA